jgi:hypothetical protein
MSGEVFYYGRALQCLCGAMSEIRYFLVNTGRDGDETGANYCVISDPMNVQAVRWERPIEPIRSSWKREHLSGFPEEEWVNHIVIPIGVSATIEQIRDILGEEPYFLG